MFLFVLTGLLCLIMIFSLYRVFKGPTLFDRIAGVNLVGTKIVILILLIGFQRDELGLFVDIAISYALLSFIGSVALAKYFFRTERSL